MMPRLFINSCGYRVHDYAWHEVTPDGDVLLTGVPDDWLAAPYRERAADRPISLEAETYAVARKEGHLVLLIAGLASEVRKDFVSRTVEDCVFLLGGQDEEPLVRHVAAEALARRSNVIEILDRAISFDQANGFVADWRQLGLLREWTDLGFEPPDCAARTRKFCEGAKAEMAAELRLRRLPGQDGLLLLASPMVSESALAEAGVWRGLWGLGVPAPAGSAGAGPIGGAGHLLVGVGRSVTRAARLAGAALLPRRGCARDDEQTKQRDS